MLDSRLERVLRIPSCLVKSESSQVVLPVRLCCRCRFEVELASMFDSLRSLCMRVRMRVRMRSVVGCR